MMMDEIHGETSFGFGVFSCVLFYRPLFVIITFIIDTVQVGRVFLFLPPSELAVFFSVCRGPLYFSLCTALFA